jgi:hypothetical protein
MKSILFFLLTILMVLPSCSSSDESQECTPDLWVGTYSRISGGGCDDWEQKTEPILTVRINPFDSTQIIFYTSEPRSVTGCEITTVYAGTETTYEKDGNEITVTSDLTGCRATFRKN